ncbi:hypothetical protein SRHO_G00340280 [Serrasalmus rhombeus]
MRLYLKCVEDIRREIATLPLQITDFYMFLLIEFLGTKTVALVPKSWGKHDVRILKSCNKLFQRFQLEVIQLQYPGSPLLQGCTNLSGRGRGQEQRVFPALNSSEADILAVVESAKRAASNLMRTGRVWEYSLLSRIMKSPDPIGRMIEELQSRGNAVVGIPTKDPAPAVPAVPDTKYVHISGGYTLRNWVLQPWGRSSRILNPT